MLKRAISIILTFTTLFTLATIFTSCSDSGSTSETEKYVFEHTETKIVETEGETVTLNGKDPVELSFFPSTNLSNGMEIVFNFTSTSANDFDVIFRAYSDSVETDFEDYYTVTFPAKEGTHEYRFPLSEFSKNGDPFGWNNITEFYYIFPSSANATVTIDSIRLNENKYGTIHGFTYKEIKTAVCFYEDCGLYFVDQFRKTMSLTDDTVAVKSDDDSTYVPISVLAEYRGATDIVATAEKTSFTYNGTAYEFKAGDSVEIIGDAQGFRPGKAMSLKTLVSGEHVLVPDRKSVV